MTEFYARKRRKYKSPNYRIELEMKHGVSYAELYKLTSFFGLFTYWKKIDKTYEFGYYLNKWFDKVEQDIKDNQ